MPLWPALMVSRGITKRTKLTVESTVGTVTDHPACVKGLYSTLGIDAGAPLNSLATYDDLGNLLAFDPEQFDGTNIVVHWKDSYAAADADRFLYWDPTVDPGSSLADPTAVWSNGFAAVYHMGDAGPTNVLDSLGVYNGVQSGGVTFGATGQIGKCLSFDGSNDAVSMGDVLDLTGIDDPRSWSCWVKCSNAATNPAIISKDEWTSPWTGWLMEYISATQMRWQLYQGTDNRLGKIWDITHDPTAWTHVAVVKGNRTAAQLQLYINGVEITSVATTYDSLSSLLDNPFPYQIASRDGANQLLNGSVEEVRDATAARAAAWPLAETLFGLGTAVTVGAVETYQPPGGLPLILGRAGRSGPSLAGLRC